MTARTAGKRGRGGGPRAIAATLPRVTGTVFGKRGFPGGAIVNDWPMIAGAHLARHSAPEKVDRPRTGDAGGTLHLRIDSGSMATELQHLEPLLIERVNGYFGFKAVSRLKIIQGPLPETGARPASNIRPLAAAEETSLAESLMDVDDPDLRRALQGLGRAVLARGPEQ